MLINTLRKTAGPSIADLDNKRYRELKSRVVTLAQYSNKVIFVSGHEHSLQYIVEEKTKGNSLDSKLDNRIKYVN